jgi:hypothetical protein
MTRSFSTFIRDNSLTIVLGLMFLGSIVGHALFGYQNYNEEAFANGVPAYATLWDYLASGDFVSSVAENWESEFLQMAVFVYLSVFLYQRGSAESKPAPGEETPEQKQLKLRDEKISKAGRKKWPVLFWLYEHSLTLALVALFVASFALHAYGTELKINEENLIAGKPPLSTLEVLAGAEFWFESFQNWQSEFFSIAILGLLSIHLRQKDSPQSKHLWQTADETEG